VVDDRTSGGDLPTAPGPWHGLEPSEAHAGGSGLKVRLEACWRRTDELLALVAEDELLAAPVPGQPPFLFHVGHLATFAATTLGANAVTDPELDDLFGRPAQDAGGLSSRRWPRREQVDAHRDEVRAAVRAWLDGRGDEARAPVEDVLLHESMHHEQLLGLLHHLPGSGKRAPEDLPRPSFATATARRTASVPAGAVPAGVLMEEPLEVPAFRIGTTPVMTGEFYEFVCDGGYEDARHWNRDDWEWRLSQGLRHPRTWRRVGTQWLLRGLFEDLPIERVFDWPASVSLPEARAWARWKGQRLPTEGEWLRAVHGGADGEWRPFPWGSEAPRPEHGNFGLTHWSATPVGSYPEGATASGVLELLGNGWEWVAEPDGEGVLRGASWGTDPFVVARGIRRRVDPRSSLPLTKFRTVDPA
jgi:formylglycine-generating enzyme required for sulfatase activity